MKISNIAALVLVSLATVGCSEIPAVTSPNEPTHAVTDSFTVLSVEQQLEREAAYTAAQLEVKPADQVPLNVAADSELNSHLVSIITDIEYYGEVGYWFTVEKFAGELHHDDYRLTDVVLVPHKEITNHVTLGNCVGQYVFECEK